MNRSNYFSYIEEKLHVLANRIETRGKLNLLDLHEHSENFFSHFFNILFGYKLENLNSEIQNVESVDLIDDQNKILIQVSATCTRRKIELTLSGGIIKNLSEYTFKFISISKDASGLRKMNFQNPYSIKFDPAKDIWDITSILRQIGNESAARMKGIYDFIRSELGGEVDMIRVDSNLAAIINILSKEQWDESNQVEIEKSFEIDKKITFNKLKRARDVIEEYRVYYKKVDEKYAEFDAMGVNKSNSVLATIKREYRNLKEQPDPDYIFDTVVERIIDKILGSPNFEPIPIDELNLCVDILVVDAFIRCKIFENPENYSYASAR
jgi:hypothetical protein